MTHGGGSITPTSKPDHNSDAWWREHHGLAALHPHSLDIIEGTIHSKMYHGILHKKVRACICYLKLKRGWVIQRENDPKHTKQLKNG